LYGKIFDSMYDGTLYGQWEAIVTFQQLIVLCDADGTVDMTPPAISARTSIPLEIITKGLKTLAEADPYSRTQGADGRRIELIDGHRPWGWVIVNHEKYQKLQDSDTVRAQTRERVAKHRAKKNEVTASNGQVTDGNGSKRYTDTDTDTDTKKQLLASGDKSPSACEQPPTEETVKQLIGIPLNSGSDYPITEQMVKEWEGLYPAVDVMQTLREIRGWNLANREKRKTKTGVLKHVNTWLAREQNKGA
jgi:hypothetical protein